MVNGGYLRELRKNINLTQSELAEKVGISRNTVYDWERNAYLPTDANKIAALEDVFGLKRGELFLQLQPAANPQSPHPEKAAQG